MSKIQNTAVGVPFDGPTTVPDSTVAGEPEGPSGQDIANAAGKAADADMAANVAGLARAGKRQDADTGRHRVR